MSISATCRIVCLGLLAILSLGGTGAPAAGQDLADQVRQLQEADRQRQVEIEQLKGLNQALLERLGKLEIPAGAAEPGDEKPGDADPLRGRQRFTKAIASAAVTPRRGRVVASGLSSIS